MEHIKDISKGLLESVKNVMESKEQIDELSKKTLVSYTEKSQRSANKALAKSDKEEDKAMSTDGEKYPEKQQKHIDNAKASFKIFKKREAGQKMSLKKLGLKEEDGKPTKIKLTKGWGDKGKSMKSSYGKVVDSKEVKEREELS